MVEKASPTNLCAKGNWLRALFGTETRSSCALAALFFICLFATGCGDVQVNPYAPHSPHVLKLEPDPQDKKPHKGSHAFAGKTLRFLVYKDYLSPEIGTLFEQQFGSRIEFVTFTNFAQGRSLFLERKDLDVVLLSSHFIDDLYINKRLQALPEDQMTNLTQLREPGVLKQEPMREVEVPLNFAVPYLFGSIGVAYNSRYLGGTVDIKWKDVFNLEQSYPQWAESLKGSVLVMDEGREVFGLAHLALGQSVNSTNETEIAKAAQLIKDFLPYVSAFENYQIVPRLLSGEDWMSICWSAEAQAALQANPEIKFIIPSDGTITSLDQFAILATAPEPQLAARFIDFMLDPQVIAKSCNYNNYASVIKAADTFIDPRQVLGRGYATEYRENEYFLHGLPRLVEFMYLNHWTQIRVERHNRPLARKH